jgi:hypothetical protein
MVMVVVRRVPAVTGVVAVAITRAVAVAVGVRRVVVRRVVIAVHDHGR